MMRDLATFLMCCFGAAYLLQYLLSIFGGLRSPWCIPMLLGMMFLPSICAYMVITTILKSDPMSFGIAKAPIKYYVISICYPIACIGLGLIFIKTLGMTEVQLKELPSNLLRHLGISPEASPLLGGLAWILVALMLMLAPFINSIPALGEEYGWRGYLLDRLTPKLGMLKSNVLIGALWGIWHAPSILMGFNYPNHPNLVGICMFCIFCILVGVFLGWLRIRSGSIFPPALCHGALNAYAGLGFILAPVHDELLGVPLGIPGILGLGLVALVAAIDLRLRTADKRIIHI